MVDTVNQELVVKFTREVAYRLSEIEEDVDGRDTVTSADLVVFNHYDQSTVIHGDVTGGVVNVGPGTATGSNVAINTVPELIAAFNSLRAELTDAAAKEACDLLVQEIQGAKDEQSILRATRQLTDSEPEKKKKLMEILSRIGTSLLSSAIFHSIKSSLGF